MKPKAPSFAKFFQMHLTLKLLVPPFYEINLVLTNFCI